MVYYIIIMEKQGDCQGDYFQEIQQQSSIAEKNDERQRQLHYQERTSISDFIEDSAMAEDDDLQKNDVDDELALMEKAFDYLTRKTYPPGCSKSNKRVIRRKVEKLEERNGEIFYKKRGAEDFAVLPSPSYIRAFRSAKNIVTDNRKVYVDRSDKRRHENGMDMSACGCYMYIM